MELFPLSAGLSLGLWPLAKSQLPRGPEQDEAAALGLLRAACLRAPAVHTRRHSASRARSARGPGLGLPRRAVLRSHLIRAGFILVKLCATALKKAGWFDEARGP
jgi:hypothetical protein